MSDSWGSKTYELVDEVEGFCADMVNAYDDARWHEMKKAVRSLLVKVIHLAEHLEDEPKA